MRILNLYSSEEAQPFCSGKIPLFRKVGAGVNCSVGAHGLKTAGRLNKESRLFKALGRIQIPQKVDRLWGGGEIADPLFVGT